MPPFHEVIVTDAQESNPAATPPAVAPPHVVHWYAPAWGTLHLLTIVAGHLIVAAALLGSGVLLDRFVKWLGDPYLYDSVPLRYVVDTMDGGVLLAFITLGPWSFWMAMRREG